MPQGPPIPDWATTDALDKHVVREFEALGERRSEEVPRRLTAAYVAAEEGDFETALGHAAVVRVVGARLAAAREAAGIISYRCGEYELAARDLKAARRISGSIDTLPVLADCERGLGRPERALELAASPEAARLDQDGRVEMLIVASGARQDLGQDAAAVLTLQVPELEGSSEAPWQERLWFGYSEALRRAGRTAEADTWLARAAKHPAHVTVAADVLAELQGGAGGGRRSDVGSFVDLEEDGGSEVGQGPHQRP